MISPRVEAGVFPYCRAHRKTVFLPGKHRQWFIHDLAPPETKGELPTLESKI